MASLNENSYFSGSRKVVSLYFAFLFFTSLFINAYSEAFPTSNVQFSRKKMLGLEDEDFEKPIKKSSTSSTSLTSLSSKKTQTKLLKPVIGLSKNQTKLIKSTTGAPSKNQTKLIKTTSDSTKNKTKLVKPISDTLTDSSASFKNQPKKLNLTSKSPSSTKSTSLLINKSSDLSKTTSANIKATKSPTTKEINIQHENTQKDSSNSQGKKQSLSDEKPKSQKIQKKTQSSWFDQDDEDDDLVAGFKDLPSKFQESLLPDLETISRTSQVYLTRYNREIAKNVKPIVGKKYASSISSFISFAFIIIPLILVSLIFNRIKAYFSLQKLLIFIQIYLAIYFAILSLSSLVTGLEPLKFFYATSQSTYVGLQVLQTLGYVLYLLLLLMYMVLVFSTETGPVSKLLALGQTFVGFSVGLHYYMKVFHRAVLRQPPKTSWKVHALYATCFLFICLLTNADRRKKAYLEEDGEEGKKN